jgi:thymidylate kinase
MLDPNIEPALTLLFDADLAVAMHRLKTERKLDRIEKEPIEFFNTVQQAYYALLNENSQRIKLISTNVSIAETEQNLLVYLNEFMKNA